MARVEPEIKTRISSIDSASFLYIDNWRNILYPLRLLDAHIYTYVYAHVS